MSQQDILSLNEKLEDIDFTEPWSVIISEIEDIKRELLDIYDNVFAPSVICFGFSRIYGVTVRQPNNSTLNYFRVRDRYGNIFRMDDTGDKSDIGEHNYLLKPKVYLGNDTEPSSVIIMHSRDQTLERVVNALDLINSEICYRTSRKK